MESEISLEDMAKEINELDTQLRDMKKAYLDKLQLKNALRDM